MARLIFQMHIRDHATPVIQAFNDLCLPAEGMPQMPTDLVSAEQNSHRGGCIIRLMPSSALLAWMTEVQARREAAGFAIPAHHLGQAKPLDGEPS